MFKKLMFLLLPIVLITASITACKLPSRDDMRQADYGDQTRAEVSQGVIDDIAGLFDDLRDGVQTGSITRTYTESQTTAIIAEKIGGAEDVPISNVLVNFEPDAMLMAADWENEDKVHAIVAEFTVAVSDDGESLELTLGDFTVDGLLASLIPQIKTQFTDKLNDGLQTATGDETMTISAITVPDGATIDSIVLVEGSMTITGTADMEVPNQ